jgi:CubicO group peptidase (beta-lactamase class C family)
MIFKKAKKRHIAAGLVTCCVIFASLWLMQPSNYYIRRALVHFTPKIDQYPVFENRIVEAGDPCPWPVSEYYNKLSIPDRFIKDFDKYGTVAYVIIRNGELLFEQYWDDYSPRSHSNSFSMAKSIVSFATGCAIDDGAINSVDQPVSDFFPQFGSYNGKPLTLRHLLTMSAGVDFQESYTSLFSPTAQLYYGDNLRAITFGMKQIEEPGVNFIYQSGVTQLLAFVLEKATGEHISSYVSRKLWTPIQAEEDALWSLDRKDGFEKAYCCFNSNARDFARLGQLVLNGGRWNGKQIVPEQYLTDATAADSNLIFKKYGETNRQYGYQCWLLEKNGINIPYLRGMKGQYIFIIPERNAIVVRLGHERAAGETDDQHYPADVDIWLDAAFEMLDETPERARLVFGGDLMQHLPQINAARNGGNGCDYTESFQYVKPLFRNADLAILNLETTLTPSLRYTGYPRFRSPPALADVLSEMGIDAVVLANNHICDNGREGINYTTHRLDSLGIAFTGAFADSLQYSRFHPLRVNVNGIRLAIFNYTYGTNGLPVPQGAIVNPIDTPAIARDLSRIDRREIDGVAVFFHWGDEYVRQPSPTQHMLAEYCRRRGVEIVIGSHPHVIQPVDLHADGDGIIRSVTLYSLGNLVSNQRDRYRNGGLIVTLDLEKTAGQPLHIRPSYTPVWVSLPGYRILTPPVADTVALSDRERKEYLRFMQDTREWIAIEGLTEKRCDVSD